MVDHAQRARDFLIDGRDERDPNRARDLLRIAREEANQIDDQDHRDDLLRQIDSAQATKEVTPGDR